jgi:hypothetical protein
MDTLKLYRPVGKGIPIEEHLKFVEAEFMDKPMCALMYDSKLSVKDFRCVTLSCIACVYSDRRAVKDILDADILEHIE